MIFRRRSKSGFSIAETAASMSLLLPLSVVILFAMLETSYGLFLKATLAEASRTAARNLAVAYGQNPLIANDWSLEDSLVLSKVRIPNVVNSSAQFDPPTWNTNTAPYTVTTHVHYASGQYGLPPFPCPDVLKLGAGFVPSANSTYKLE